MLPLLQKVTARKFRFYRFDGSRGYLYFNKLHFESAPIRTLQAAVEFRTRYQALDTLDDMSLLDFDGRKWFSIYIDGATSTVVVNTTGNGSSEAIVGTTIVNDGEWHTVEFNVCTKGGLTAMSLLIDGSLEKTALAHPGGIGVIVSTRYGTIGDSSQATHPTGIRGHDYFNGDIRSIRMATPVSDECEETNVCRDQMWEQHTCDFVVAYWGGCDRGHANYSVVHNTNVGFLTTEQLCCATCCRKTPTACPACGISPQQALQGADLGKRRREPTAVECAYICYETAGCAGFIYFLDQTENCQLKSTITGSESMLNVQSGKPCKRGHALLT